MKPKIKSWNMGFIFERESLSQGQKSINISRRLIKKIQEKLVKAQLDKKLVTTAN